MVKELVKGSEVSEAWAPLSGSGEWASSSLIPLPPAQASGETVLWAEATAIIHQSLAA